MPIQIKNTAEVGVNGIKAVVYGPAGSGKTTLCGTAPNPIILSAESGLLSLRGQELPYIEIDSHEALVEVYDWVMESKESKQFDTICLDSLSEIGEVVLADLKKRHKDPRQAYGEVQEQMLELIRNFRDMPGRNVYFACKEEDTKDGTTGAINYRPMMPGTKLPNQVPYFFDEVFQMYVYTDPQTKEETRALRTRGDNKYVAKDRSGSLDMWEPPDLTHIFNKIIHG
jgi:phage nucleotide-binding protein